MNRALVVTLIVIAASFATTQGQRIGYINSDTIRQGMPAFKQMLIELDTQRRIYEKEGERLMAAYDKMQSQIAMEQPWKSTPDSVVENKINELLVLRKKIETFSVTIKEQMEQLRETKLKTVNALLFKGVREAAIARGYDYIIDTALKGVIYCGENADDLNEAVLIKLGALPK
jgi:outer membrane protein